MAAGLSQDDLPVETVGRWAKDKHAYLCRYLDASRGARIRFLGESKAGATFADFFCGSGRSHIRDSEELIEGSPVAAWRASAEGIAPFGKMFIADLDATKRAACAARLTALAAPVHELAGGALAAARSYVKSVHPEGLHLVFLDPYSLGALDFEIVREVAKLKRVDMLIHVSAMDLRRNIGSALEAEDYQSFDAFAPGWRESVDTKGTHKAIRQRVLDYWASLVMGLGMKPFSDVRPISADGGQHLYWLMLASRHPLAHDLWKKIGRADRQGEMEF